jgi:hypothetical protein
MAVLLHNLYAPSAPHCTASGTALPYPACRPPAQMDAKVEYDKVIEETQAAYLKILESSQTLLTVLKRESINMQKRTGRAS